MRSILTLAVLICVVISGRAQFFAPSGSTTIQTTSNGMYGINATGVAQSPFPQFTFEVVGSTAVTGQMIRNTSSTGYTTFRLYNNQNNLFRALELAYSGSSFASPLIYGGVASGEMASISTTGSYPLMFGTSNTMRMTIAGNGNIGVGTNNPQQQFEVVNGNRAVSFNNAIAGVTTGGILAISRADDGMKTMYLGPSAAPADDNVIYGSGGGAELRLVSGGLASGGFGFYINMDNSTAFASTRPTPVMKIDGLGNVGIGDPTPDAKLAVNGTVRSKEVLVTTTGGWPDYVFNPDYKLPTLKEVRSYIDQHHHLPEVPSLTEVEQAGVKLGEMNALLLKKIEELTLYVIEQQSQMEAMQEQINEMKRK